MNPKSLIYVEFFLFLTLMMLILVPRRRIVDLLPFGLIAGLGVAILVQTSAIWYLKLWRWNYTQSVGWRGLPLFVSAAWIPVEIIFAHYFSRMNRTLVIPAILAIAGASTAVEWLFIRGGYFTHLYWNYLATFILGVVIHSLLAVYLLAYHRAKTPQQQ